MPHVVTENCISCRFTDCVTVCPVSCFHGDEERLYIDPDACVDCGACVPACPVSAIAEMGDLDDGRKIWLSINANRAAATPLITGKQNPLPSAAERRAQLGF